MRQRSSLREGFFILLGVAVLAGGCSALPGQDRSLGFHPGLTFSDAVIPAGQPVLSPLRSDGVTSQAGCATCAH